MTVKVIDDLHRATDPAARISHAAREAARIIIRAPDRDPSALRILRANDVARMLQRHGRIRELAVTDGGTIVAAADVCERRGELAVWTGQSIGPWAPSDIVARGLGGSETAAVRLAEQFAEMGWIVTLYGHFEDESMAGDIMLRRFETFDPTQPLDALIGFRNATLFDERPNARFCALWLEDLAPAEALTPARAQNIDKVFGVTGWHKQQIEETHPWIDAAQVVAGRNGIVHRYFTDEPEPEREKRVVYSSSPDRGGDIVLELWPQIRERVPDAELILTYSRWFDLVAGIFKDAGEQLQRIRDLLEQPGVQRIEGGLGQKALAHLMRTSLVWCAPSWYTPGDRHFDETSCISAMEAQAAGLVVVASNWGALTETVQTGTLIDGDPREKDGSWRKQFVDAIVRGLTHGPTQQGAQIEGPQMVRDMDWRGAAEQVQGFFAPAVRHLN